MDGPDQSDTSRSDIAVELKGVSKVYRRLVLEAVGRALLRQFLLPDTV